jgi:hypothetical protein
MTVPVPVSGEDQPDPRVNVAALALFKAYGPMIATDHPVRWHRALAVAVEIIAALGSADRAAGIRRVTEDTAAADRVRAWCAYRRAHHISPDDLLGVSYRPAPLFLADLESLVGGS